jgi:glycyl-tRNA synthetase beta chain
MTTKNLLVELFVEELPPKALKKLGDAFAGVLFEQLKAQGLTTAESALTSFASPRRLAAHVTYVLPQGADKAVSQKLMPVAVGLGADGNATPALLKKLAALGADASVVAALKRAPDGKAEALFYDSLVKGAMLAEGLQKALIDAIAKLPIPKVMTYQLADGWSDVKFVRPAHGLVALHGGDVVAIEALGLKAGNTTHGHRFEALVDPVVLQHADSYAATLQKDGAVIASFAERRAEIVRQLDAAAAKVGNCKPIDDDALLDEVTALVERPNVLVCEFEKEFLDVPQECLILTMKANQKYFPLLDSSGKLTNKFLVVSNISPKDASFVIGGNERVVRPRLADAKFFFDQDRKKTLASRVEGLGKVVYHNKLGSQGERVERVRAIAKAIGQQLGGDILAAKADQAAQLAKTDLVTDMVGEFPELQGTMGRYYALNDGLSADVADAIEDHYKPRFAGDELPRNEVGVVVALADKLETLVGMFGIGNLPTGDKDPFALRRHALGVVRMLVEKDLPLSQYDLIQTVFKHFPEGLLSTDFQSDGMTLPKAMQVDWLLNERAVTYWRDKGYPDTNVQAVHQVSDVPSDHGKRLAAVQCFAELPEAPALAAANKRVSNIFRKIGKKPEPMVNTKLFIEPAEHTLYETLKLVKERADFAWANGDYTGNLQALAALKRPIDEFFDKVMVYADDPVLQTNRLGLLATLHAAMNRVADLSKLAT